MPIKLYLSQANQAHNAGPGGYTEKAGCAAINKALAKLLKEDKRFRVKRNSTSGVDTAVRNTNEANAWRADIYVATHTNAGMKGTITFYHSRSPKGKKLAEALLRALAGLSPGAEVGDRSRPMDGFIEIHRPNCPATLVEIEAHDWRRGTDFLTDEIPAITRAMYEGICRGVGLKPIAAAKKRQRIKVTDRDITIRRQYKPHRAGWYNLGVRPFYKRLVLQGHGKRITLTPDTVTFPVPVKKRWWWKAAKATEVKPAPPVPVPAPEPEPVEPEPTPTPRKRSPFFWRFKR